MPSSASQTTPSLGLDTIFIPLRSHSSKKVEHSNQTIKLFKIMPGDSAYLKSSITNSLPKTSDAFGLTPSEVIYQCPFLYADLFLKEESQSSIQYVSKPNKTNRL